jgi:hypothetical protein
MRKEKLTIAMSSLKKGSEKTEEYGSRALKLIVKNRT